MHYSISQESIKNTTKCKSNFSCFINNQPKFCKIDHSISDKIYIINCESTTMCNYKIFYGDSMFCSCPVRIEFYNRYKI